MKNPINYNGPPVSDQLTKYDEQHLATYLRLLDADNEGADWREAVSIIFKIDPMHNPRRAQLIYDTHLARARRMTETGYRLLLRPSST